MLKRENKTGSEVVPPPVRLHWFRQRIGYLCIRGGYPLQRKLFMLLLSRQSLAEGRQIYGQPSVGRYPRDTGPVHMVMETFAVAQTKKWPSLTCLLNRRQSAVEECQKGRTHELHVLEALHASHGLGPERASTYALAGLAAPLKQTRLEETCPSRRSISMMTCPIWA